MKFEILFAKTALFCVFHAFILKLAIKQDEIKL